MNQAGGGNKAAQGTPPKGYACEWCGKWHDFPMYVYAHSRDVLDHACECGAKHSIIMQTARMKKRGRKAARQKQAAG